MKLARRERYLVTVASLAVFLFLAFHFAVIPFFEKMANLRSGIDSRERALRDMAGLAAQYREITENSKGREELIRRRPKGFTLFSFLEKAAGESAVKDRIKYMKPSTSQTTGPYKESMVEMQMEEITLKQLVDYLYRVEYGDKLVQIKRVSIKESRRESGYLDAVIQVVSVE
ncbi:MAG: hypothetical protein C4582_13670 [Desulfobacteraceae bacterium]|jgi:general secretion pathway protein M|nr:MAG: hypothetical protein C4582_13670 [Desulfobacteraceae bacterium]